jgi:two-component system, NtrC family, sensor histidine kinase HydH
VNPWLLVRLTAPALITGLLLIGVGLGGAWSIHRLQSNLTHILSEHVASVQASQDLENAMRQLRYHVLRHLVRPTPQTRAQVDADEEAFENAFRRATAAASSPAERRYLELIGSGYDKYKKEIAKLLEEAETAGPPTDFARYDRRHPIRHITTPCQQLGEYNQQQLDQTVAESEDLGRRSRNVLILLGVAGPAGGLLVGYGFARGLSRSLERLRVSVRDVVDRLEAGTDSKGGVHLRLGGGSDPAALDRELQHVVRRIEELMERLQAHQRDVLRAEQLAAVGQLAAGVAHEVRNPLTGMKLLVEAALRPNRPRPLTEEDLRIIHGEIARLEEIVQHFLDFARPQPLRRSPVDLREATARSVELTRGRARQQEVEVAVESPDEPLPLLLDSGQFQTVLVNLLLNALDAMPHGGRVTVRLERDGPEARLTVRDSGPGIAPELLPRLFTTFASTRPTGTGLGLSLARRIVSEHGGRIEAGNHPDGGACFAVNLPLEETTCPDCC